MHGVNRAWTRLNTAIETPAFVGREINRLYYTRGYRRAYNRSGLDVMAQEWDNLLLLDACRYDTFVRTHDLPGRLRAVESRAAHTSEFILGNIHRRDLTDTVYVTASPILERGSPRKYAASFHAVVNVWEDAGWDETHKTVLPETMVTYALDAIETYPNKRVLVHFMQPHYPFIGTDLAGDGLSVPDPAELVTDIWNELMVNSATVSRAAVAAAYQANVAVVLPHVRQLMETLPGLTVVTSDHGNMLGERSRPVPIVEWGHPPGIYTPELVTVPWLEYAGGDRREIVAEPPESRPNRIDDERVRSRLRELGYVS